MQFYVNSLFWLGVACQWTLRRRIELNYVNEMRIKLKSNYLILVSELRFYIILFYLCM